MPLGNIFLLLFGKVGKLRYSLVGGDPWMFLSPYFGHLEVVEILSPFSVQVLRLLSKKRMGIATHLPSAYSIYAEPIHFITLSRFELCLGKCHCIDRRWFLPITCNSTPQLPSSEMTLNYRMIMVGNLNHGCEIVSLLDMKLPKWSSTSCIPKKRSNATPFTMRAVNGSVSKGLLECWDLYPPHTCWWPTPMNDSYQQWALLELF
jgi:hypothetical protein